MQPAAATHPPVTLQSTAATVATVSKPSAVGPSSAPAGLGPGGLEHGLQAEHQQKEQPTGMLMQPTADGRPGHVAAATSGAMLASPSGPGPEVAGPAGTGETPGRPDGLSPFSVVDAAAGANSR